MLTVYLIVVFACVVVNIIQIDQWSKGNSLVDLLVVIICSGLWPLTIALGIYLKLTGRYGGTTDD